VVEIVPALVVEIVPTAVVEIVPTAVVEIVPVRVVEIVPLLARAVPERLSVNTNVNVAILKFVIVFAPGVSTSGVFGRLRSLSLGSHCS